MTAPGFGVPLDEGVGARVQEQHLGIVTQFGQALDGAAQIGDRATDAGVDRDRDPVMSFGFERDRDIQQVADRQVVDAEVACILQRLDRQ